MLNITTRISLSKASKGKIKRLRNKSGGQFTVDSWRSIHKDVKNEISKKILNTHSPRCIYCERFLIGTGNQIDHFAHKALYPQFTFTPINLFYSCSYCNSSSRKGQKNTILPAVQPQYQNNTFSIVHPFFQDPDVEIIFLDADRITFDWNACSQLGKDTITFFGWQDEHMTLVRARSLLIDRAFPLNDVEAKKLIEEIISYKR